MTDVYVRGKYFGRYIKPCLTNQLNSVPQIVTHISRTHTFYRIMEDSTFFQLYEDILRLEKSPRKGKKEYIVEFMRIYNRFYKNAGSDDDGSSLTSEQKMLIMQDTDQLFASMYSKTDTLMKKDLAILLPVFSNTARNRMRFFGRVNYSRYIWNEFRTRVLLEHPEWKLLWLTKVITMEALRCCLSVYEICVHGRISLDIGETYIIPYLVNNVVTEIERETKLYESVRKTT
jgi:hypothetical protein